MNLLYIHTHDSGRYFAPYGYPVPSPSITALAKQAVLFRNAHCCAPTCSPSRAALLTGQYAHTSGMLGLAHRGFSLKNPERHLSHYLRGQGYETVLAGVQHEAATAAALGYDHVFRDTDTRVEGRVDAIGRDHANARQVCDYLAQPHDRPFFVSFGMFSTHREYPEPAADINPDYIRPPWPVADTLENRRDMAGYLTSARCADDCVGMVLAALKEAGLADSTLVVFTTDHGLAFPMMKCNLYDTGTGVTLMLRYPGNMAAGQVSDQLVSHVDVFPTLCDVLGLPQPDWLQGVSLLPVINENRAVRDEVFAEVTYHAAYEPKRSVRTARHKLIRHYDVHNGVVPANIDASPAKTLLMDSGYLNAVIPREELYDLALDPVERVNMVSDPRYQAVYEDLSARLYRWMQDTDDPLLTWTHRVPKPEGARVNLRASLEPTASDWEDPD